MSDYTPSPVIHHALLDVARGLLTSAHKFAEKGDEGSVAKSRSCCLGVLILATSALEAAINVFAGAYYADGPGRYEAENSGWHNRWHGSRGYSLRRKWTEFAPKLGGRHFVRSAWPGWEKDLKAMINCRNEFVVHFKGRWAPESARTSFAAISIADANRWFGLARHLVNTLHSGYMHTHSATTIGEVPGTPYPTETSVHAFIPPVSIASAGTQAMGFLYPPKEPEAKEDADGKK